MIEELKRRKVFQVAGVYLATMWLISQIVVSIEEPLNLPAWFDTGVIVLLGAGFPIALILAWAFEISPDGQSISRLEGARKGLTTTVATTYTVLVGAIALALFLFLPSADPDYSAEARRGAQDTLLQSDIPVPGFGGRGAVAVLPFVNMSADGANEHIADGIAEDILTSLQGWGVFPVLSRSSTFAYKGQAVDIPQVAAKLGVRYILEGSVQRSGDTIRITAQLIDARTDSHLWAQKYDRQMSDVFAIQDEISERIVTSIAPEITRNELKRVASLHPAELVNWELTMKAQMLVSQGDYEAAIEAKRMLEEALVNEPGYALAHARLAEICHDLGEFYWNYQTVEESNVYHAQGREHARRAVELNPSLVDARIWYGHLLLHNREFSKGVAQLRQGVEINPSHGQARAEYGFGLALVGETDNALKELEVARRLSPNDPRRDRIDTFEALVFLYAGDNAAAVNSARRVIDSRFGEQYAVWAHIVETSALSRMGRVEAAKASAEEYTAAFGRVNWTMISRGAWTERELAEVEKNLRSLDFIEG